MTKDSDFLFLLDRFGVPPQIIWLTCGNTSNARLKEILALILENAIQLLENGEEIVEINSI
jgi:predicted nuclease of predicted toxin-antitoxin system